MATGSTHGGKRAGAGRKSKGSRDELEGLLKKGWPYAKRLEHIQNLSKLADANDKEAIKTLLAYAYGRPTERKEIMGPDGKAIPISIINAVKPS